MKSLLDTCHIYVAFAKADLMLFRSGKWNALYENAFMNCNELCIRIQFCNHLRTEHRTCRYAMRCGKIKIIIRIGKFHWHLRMKV